MTHKHLTALSPLDGRYAVTVESLSHYFSELALIRERVVIEIEYLLTLGKLHTKESSFPRLSANNEKRLKQVISTFGLKEAQQVKKIEQKTHHDVKAVEYYLQGVLEKHRLDSLIPFIHFGLTSEDVNNLAYGRLINRAIQEIIIPEMKTVIHLLEKQSERWKKIKLLSMTHGQPATPTTLGKEIMVFVERLHRQYVVLSAFTMSGKFGGAVGNYSAHRVAFPRINWSLFGKEFVQSLSLEPLTHTTQINPHDDIAELAHLCIRINTILHDYVQDMWLYISRGIFVQKSSKDEVGSSTMPHKTNPIDFENAEGNLGIATALFAHFAEKLPRSRMQRDLSDSTVQRNIGVAFGHHLLALQSLQKGIKKLTPDTEVITEELQKHPEVISEAIQTLLRSKGKEKAYEQLKALTKGQVITREALLAFMQETDLTDSEIQRVLKQIE